MMEQDARYWSLNARQMLGLYAVIPLLLGLVFVDKFFLHSAVRQALPTMPETMLWWTIVFNIPHIMGSLVTYVDKEYLVHYRAMLIRGTIVSAMLVVFLPMISTDAYNIILATYTMYHVLMQQFGIAIMFMRRRPDAIYKSWRWMSITSASLIYLVIYMPYMMSPAVQDFVRVGGYALCAAAAIPGGYYLWNAYRDPAVPRNAVWYFAGTYVMVAVSLALYSWGYTVFMILVPRFIHDYTAFTVYAVHDRNRNLEYPHNYIYRGLKFLRISPALLCIPLAIGIAWYLSIYLQDNKTVAKIVSTCIFLHYYMESYMWRREAPHRRYVPFVHV